MNTPQCKINIAGTDYISIAQSVNVKRRENNYDVATVIIPDPAYSSTNTYSLFSEIKIYLKDATDSVWGDPIFGGYIREKNPLQTENERLLTLNCKSYGAALEDTNCNRDYGVESSHADWDYANEICNNAIADMVNKSFGDTATGYDLTNSYVSDFCDTQIKYINNPYRSNIDLINIICQLTSAIGGGSTAGAHWIVDTSKQFLFAKIGDHAAGASSPETYWPDWWNTNQAGSTLTQGVDFQSFSILDKTEEYANNVVLCTDMRRPSYDSWFASLWGNEDLESITDHTTADEFIVGTSSLKFDTDTVIYGYGYYPSTADAEWDITKWGSVKTIPRVNFYVRKHHINTALTYIVLSTNTTARKTDYFYLNFQPWSGETDDKWYFKSIPIGPYWASTDESKEYRWQEYGDPDWNKIDSVEFWIEASESDGYLLIDDFHFTGKVIRSAKHSQAITAYKEHQKIFLSRNSMDDSCLAADDTGFAGRIAYAELLRRIYQPKTVIFTTTTNMKTALAGQKIHVHAGLKSDSSYVLNADMRIIELQHNYSYSLGYSATVTATTDLSNSFPINVPDQYAMWQENMFRFSSEAKNIRSGSEIDLLIPQLIYDYGP